MDCSSSGTFAGCCYCYSLVFVIEHALVVGLVAVGVVVRLPVVGFGSLLRSVAGKMSCWTAKALTGRKRPMVRAKLATF